MDQSGLTFPRPLRSYNSNNTSPTEWLLGILELDSVVATKESSIQLNFKYTVNLVGTQ